MEYYQGLGDRDRKLINVLAGKSVRAALSHGIVVCHSEPGAWYPPKYSTSPCPPSEEGYSSGGLIVGRTMFETDRLPSGWAERLNKMHAVWVPTHFHKRVFAEGGVRPELLAVVPEPVEVDVYKPRANLHLDSHPHAGSSTQGSAASASPEDLYPADHLSLTGSAHEAWYAALRRRRRQSRQVGSDSSAEKEGGEAEHHEDLGASAGDKKFRFLSVFKWEERKGWRFLVEAFVREFAIWSDGKPFSRFPLAGSEQEQEQGQEGHAQQQTPEEEDRRLELLLRRRRPVLYILTNAYHSDTEFEREIALFILSLNLPGVRVDNDPFRSDAEDDGWEEEHAAKAKVDAAAAAAARRAAAAAQRKKKRAAAAQNAKSKSKQTHSADTEASGASRADGASTADAASAAVGEAEPADDDEQDTLLVADDEAPQGGVVITTNAGTTATVSAATAAAAAATAAGSGSGGGRQRQRRRLRRLIMPAIHVFRERVRADDMPALYASADCFVLPSRGEGWGRPHVEAMATGTYACACAENAYPNANDGLRLEGVLCVSVCVCVHNSGTADLRSLFFRMHSIFVFHGCDAGLPVIATHWSGPSEYMTESNSYPLAHEGLDTIAEVSSAARAWGGDANRWAKERGSLRIPFLLSFTSWSFLLFFLWFQGPFAGHKWARPSVRALRRLMRRVSTTHPAEAREKGRQARADMETRYCPRCVAQIVLQRIDELELRRRSPGAVGGKEEGVHVAAAPTAGTDAPNADNSHKASAEKEEL